MGLVALRRVESSQTKDQTHVPCIGRQIPNHWTTREIPEVLLLFIYYRHENWGYTTCQRSQSYWVAGRLIKLMLFWFSIALPFGEKRVGQWALYIMLLCASKGFLGGASSKEPTCQWRRPIRHGFEPWVRKMPWRRAWQPTPVFCLENPKIRGAWQPIVLWVARNQTQLKRLSSHVTPRLTNISDTL